MPKFHVTLYYHSNAVLTVNARDEQDAVDKARRHVTNDDILNSLIEDGSPDVEAACGGDPAVNPTAAESITEHVLKYGTRRPYGAVMVLPETISLAGKDVDLIKIENNGKTYVTFTGERVAYDINEALSEKEIELLNDRLESSFHASDDTADEDGEQDDDGDTEPEPLFSEEVIESLHIGGNHLGTAFMHVRDEADLAEAKKYLRDLNRHHMAGESIAELMQPAYMTAKEKLADVIRTFGEKDTDNNTILEFTDLNGNVIERMVMSADGDIKAFCGPNNEELFSVTSLDPSKVLEYARHLKETLRNKSCEDIRTSLLKNFDEILTGCEQPNIYLNLAEHGLDLPVNSAPYDDGNPNPVFVDELQGNLTDIENGELPELAFAKEYENEDDGTYVVDTMPIEDLNDGYLVMLARTVREHKGQHYDERKE